MYKRAEVQFIRPYMCMLYLRNELTWQEPEKNWTSWKSSDEGLWQRPKRQGKNVGCVWNNSLL